MAERDRTIRVVFLEVTASMGGVEVTTLNALSLLDRERFDVALCCPEEGDLTALCREKGVEVEILPLPKFASVSIQLREKTIVNPLAILWDLPLFLHAVSRLRRYFRHSQADLVCTKGLWAHLYGGLAARAAQLPCVWHVQEVVEKKKAFGLFPKLLRWVAAISATEIIGDAETVSAQFSNMGRLSSHVHTIYNGIDTNVFAPRKMAIEFREQFGIQRDAFVIGCVARLMADKGQHVLIKAFHSIAEKYPQMMLVLVGKGMFDGGYYERQLREMVIRLGLEGRVRFTGYVDQSAVAFNAFDVAAHVSVEPDSPLAVMEAMASGCPLVLTSVPGCEEMVRDGEVLLIPPEDPEALAQAIVKLYDDKPLRERFSHFAREGALLRFGLESSIRHLEDVLEMPLQKQES